MAKYTPEQKREAVRLYTIMGKEGTCYIADEPISNIRALCSALGISSQSLYRWDEVFEIEEDELIDAKRILEKPIKCKKEGFCNAYQSLSESNETCNMLNQCDDKDVSFNDLVNVFDPHDYPSESYGRSEIEPMTFKMGTTFFQTLAQGLGIKNYRMPLEQLYLKIGSELIKLSGLVENGVREELRIE